MNDKKNKKYPRDFSNKDLEELIDKYGDLNVDKFNVGPSYFTKASLGLIELQRRSNNKYTKLVLILTVISIFAAVFSVYYAIKDKNGDEIWKSEQIKILHDIKKNIENF